MRLGAITLFAAAWLCLLLPPTPPAKAAASRMAALAAAKLMRHADVAVLMLVSFLLSFALPFVAPHGGLFLRALGVADAQVAPILSLGQVVEVFGFFSMAWLLGRVSIKTLIVIGLTCWVARFAIWTVGSPLSLVVASMGLHGLCYAFFYGMGMVYLDRRATPDIRASAQGMHLVVTSGLGIWPANWITARIADHYSRPTPGGGSAVDYSTVFLFPLVLCVVCWLIVALFFRPPRGLVQS
ncbi:MAG: MFS transporter [Planctomycetes bacterium]|nr:MFS transporter [Planctomycetota bacterium]